jgi:YggT family protein
MDSTYLTNPAVFLVQTLFGLYILVVMLRFLLQLTRADFYNPISQFVVKVTAPPLRILRRFIPGFSGIDLSSLVFAWLLKTLELMLVLLIVGAGTHLIGTIIWAIPELVDLLFNIFLIAILIQVVLSWINPGGYNPAASLLYHLTEPLLGPARRLLPPLGGLDLSPMLVMIGLYLLKMLLLPPLKVLTGSPF